MEWINIKDSLPEEKPYRLECVLMSRINGPVFEGFFNTKTNDFMSVEFIVVNHLVTHWMKMPDPPVK
jgi:hypothetical protein